MRYQFGPFVLEPALRRLLRHSDEVIVPPKAFDILVLLVRSRDRVVTKQELLAAVWPDTAVTENTLTQRIKEVREALADEAKEPQYIRTISRVGYRFVADVTEGAAPVPVAHASETDRPHLGGGDDTSIGAASLIPPTGGGKTPAASVEEHRPFAGRLALYAAAIAIVVSIASVALWYLATAADGTPRPEARHLLVSTFGGSPRSASLSPDGQMMAFLMEAQGVPHVWIKSISSGSPVQISHGDVPAGRPRWSPRGDQIVFESRNRGIWSVPPLGGVSRQIIDVGHSPNFSQDGSTLVYEVGRVNPQPLRWGIWLADADGSHRRSVGGTPEKQNWAEPTLPALSPDGSWIAFFRHTDGPRGDVWIVRTTGGDARALTNDEREGGAPVWTRDSRAVIVSSARRGSRILWKVPIDGTPIEPVTTGAGSDDEPDVARDGRTLIYTTFRDHHALAVWDPNTNQRQALITRPLPFLLPDVSLAGDRIAFFMQAGADVHVFVATADGQTVRQLTYGTGEENVHPSWSSDGRFVYYYRHKPERSWRRVGVDGQGDVEVVKDWRWDTQNNAQIDASGRYVLYTRIGFDTGDYSKDTTFIYDLTSGGQRALDAPHMHMARWSPDGRLIAGWRHDSTVGLCETASGRCRTLGRGTRPQWSADGSAVFVERNPTATQAEWWRIVVSTGGEEPLGTVGPFYPPSPNVDVRPDGRVVYSEFERGARELWIRDWR